MGQDILYNRCHLQSLQSNVLEAARRCCWEDRVAVAPAGSGACSGSNH